MRWDFWRVNERKTNNNITSSKGSAELDSFINESQVFADRLIAGVDDLGRAADHLNDIAERAYVTGDRLRKRSLHVMRRLRQTSVWMNEADGRSDRIQQLSDRMKMESKLTQRHVTDMNMAAEDSVQVLTELNRHTDAMVRKVNESLDCDKHTEEVNALMREIAAAAELERSSVERVIGRVQELERKLADMSASVEALHDSVLDVADANREQRVLISRTADMVEEAAELAQETLQSVEQTMSDMERQREGVDSLQTVGAELQQASSELISAILALRPEETADLAVVDVEEGKRILQEIAGRLSEAGLDKKQHEIALHLALDLYRGVEAVWSNDLEGRFIYSEPAAGLLHARHREWWKRAMAGELYVSEPYISAITKRPCITLAMRFEGSACGVVGLDLRV